MHLCCGGLLETSQEVVELFCVEVVGYCAIPDALGIGFAHCCLVFWWVSEEDSAVSTRHILFLGTG